MSAHVGTRVLCASISTRGSYYKHIYGLIDTYRCLARLPIRASESTKVQCTNYTIFSEYCTVTKDIGRFGGNQSSLLNYTVSTSNNHILRSLGAQCINSTQSLQIRWFQTSTNHQYVQNSIILPFLEPLRLTDHLHQSISEEYSRIFDSVRFLQIFAQRKNMPTIPIPT